MASKMTEDSVKELIISTARTFFAKYGLSRTTVDEIAKAVHMAKSSLYYYFKSKEDIFTAVLEREMNLFRVKIHAATEAEIDPRNKLIAFVLARMECLRELLNIYNALKDDYLKHFDFIQSMRISYDLEERTAIREMLSLGIDHGIFTIKDLDLTSYAIAVAIKGFEYEWAINNDHNNIKHNVETLFETLFMGIVKR